MKIITKAIIGLFILATGMVGVRTVFADYKISHILPKTELLLGTDDETRYTGSGERYCGYG